jgi:release factor glutamine methyltransferase
MTERVWTVRDALGWTVEYLDGKQVEQPRLSAEWLLSAATGLSRVEIYAFHERPLSPRERATLREGVKRRAQGEPLQYVTGEMPFRHVVMHVRRGVFIPRPETEVLVDVALELLAGVHSPVVVDLCTGSGAVACSIAHELPAARVVATDLSPEAVSLAHENAERIGVADRVQVLAGDLFEPLAVDLRGRVDLVVSNPPYIPSADMPDLPADVLGYEPHLALDGGPDGLDTARRIMDDSLIWLADSGGLAMELDESRVTDAVKELSEWYQECRLWAVGT